MQMPITWQLSCSLCVSTELSKQVQGADLLQACTQCTASWLLRMTVFLQRLWGVVPTDGWDESRAHMADIQGLHGRHGKAQHLTHARFTAPCWRMDAVEQAVAGCRPSPA